MGFHREHCRRKRRYRNREQAQQVLDRMRRRGDIDGLAAYRCCFCAGHHLGHVPSMESLEAMALEIRGLERTGREEPS